MSKAEEPEHICGFCKHYCSDDCYCMAKGEFEIYEGDTCDNWEEDEEEC